MRARWNLWLLNKGEEPLLYFANLTDEDAHKYVVWCASKVMDGSDADAFIMTRHDKTPDNI
jgi:hypothetical protein